MLQGESKIKVSLSLEGESCGEGSGVLRSFSLSPQSSRWGEDECIFLPLMYD